MAANTVVIPFREQRNSGAMLDFTYAALTRKLNSDDAGPETNPAVYDEGAQN